MSNIMKSKPIVKIANLISMTLISIPANLIWWLFHLTKLQKALDTKSRLQKEIKTIDNVKDIVKKFKWTRDILIDWRPWVITILAREYKDDCDGAAVLAQWLLELINMKSDKYILTKVKGIGGHMICVNKNKTVMISNSDFVELNPKNWERKIASVFSYKYNDPIKV